MSRTVNPGPGANAAVSALLDSPHFAALSRASIDRLAAESEIADVCEGQRIGDEGSSLEFVYLVLSGEVLLASPARSLGPGEVFGAPFGNRVAGLHRADMHRAGSILRIPARGLNARFDSTSPPAMADPSRRPPRTARAIRGLAPWKRVAAWAASPRVLWALVGYALFLGAWYLAVDVLALPRFSKLPGLGQVIGEWTSRDPVFGLSLYTPVYYEHIVASVRRIAIAFALATVLGVPVGLFLGWSTSFREYVFPVFELLRPIPILAWVPLAIVIFSGAETPIVFLTFLASFFATALNTQLGVRSIERHYILAAQCLGASRWQTFWHVVLPGALPFIFTGLQISVGVAWFSLAAAEMISGQFGLGYLINTSYTMVQYPTIIIGMLTLGLTGFATSALVRLAGDGLMRWRSRTLALGKT